MLAYNGSKWVNIPMSQVRGVTSWNEIEDKPSTFTPSAHTHTVADITNISPLVLNVNGSGLFTYNGKSSVTANLTVPTKVSQLTNDSGYLTAITKAQVEGVLTGNITSHTHDYLPLSGGTISNNTRSLLLIKNTDSTGSSALWLGGAFNTFSSGAIVEYNGSNGGLYFVNFKAYTNNNQGIGAFRITSDNKVQCGDVNWAYSIYDMLHSGNYNSYSPTLTGTGASGTWGISITGNAATATNADMLDNVHYQNILERNYSGTASSGTSTGWFRIASTRLYDSVGVAFILFIQRAYNYINNEAYVFSISISYAGGINITQLSGYANYRLITKIRVDWKAENKAYIDLYIANSSPSNSYSWSTVGCAESYTSWTANPTLVGPTYEFTTVNGCKSDRGFTGDIIGNASSATKLQTARTIWGQSFDGTGNVDGILTLNYSSALRPTGIELVSSNNYESSIGFNSNSKRAVVGIWSDGLHLWTSSYGPVLNIPNNSYGNVGIGTTSPSYKLHIDGGASGEALMLQSTQTYTCIRYKCNATYSWDGGITSNNNNFYFYNNYKNTQVVTFDLSGNFSTIGEITAKASSSDIRLKTDITDYKALSIIRNHRSIKYHWNEAAKANADIFNDDDWHYGLIAQEVQKDLPQMVSDVFKDYLVINYERLIPICWKGLQEVDDEVTKLKKRVKQLERRL